MPPFCSGVRWAYCSDLKRHGMLVTGKRTLTGSFLKQGATSTRGETMSKHTPGPWRTLEQGRQWTVIGNPYFVATVQGQGDNGEANARLIAAAPELLEAVRLYVKLDNDRRSGCDIADADWAECHQAASAAIAKAEPKS